MKISFYKREVLKPIDIYIYFADDAVKTQVNALSATARLNGPFGPLKTNATGECLAYRTGSIKQTNMHGNRSVSIGQ